MNGIRLFLKDIRIEHTFFALPFAYTGAVFAAHGMPTWWQLLWITLAVLGARTAAMAANRYFDRDIDAKNPRTARRALASGTLAPQVMIWAIAIGFLLLLVSAWQLNPLCVKLMPIAVVGVLFYPLCKRFTWMAHFVLGAVDGLAPLGAFIGVANAVGLPAYLLFFAVTLWVAGFDIFYALMDYDIDRAQGVNSLLTQFGDATANWLPFMLHGAMLVLLALAGSFAPTSALYALGPAATIALILYEWRAYTTSPNHFVLNDRIFLSNMIFSVVFLGTTLAGFLVHYP